MTNQPVARDPQRYQPEDQFLQNPVYQPPLQASQPVAAPVAPQPVAQQPLAQPIPTVVAAPAAAPTQATSQPPVSAAALAAIPKAIPEEIIWEWEAPSRPHKKRHKQYYTTIAIILVLVGLILFFAGQFLPIAVLIAGGFLVYVLEMVPPGMVRHSITTYGLRIEGKLYHWEEMGRFWFSERYGQTLLHVEIARFPNRLTILIGNIHEDDLTELLSEALIHEQPPLTPLEKAGAWLERMLPLDSDQPKA